MTDEPIHSPIRPVADEHAHVPADYEVAPSPLDLPAILSRAEGATPLVSGGGVNVHDKGPEGTDRIAGYRIRQDGFKHMADPLFKLEDVRKLVREDVPALCRGVLERDAEIARLRAELAAKGSR